MSWRNKVKEHAISKAVNNVLNNMLNILSEENLPNEILNIENSVEQIGSGRPGSSPDNAVFEWNEVSRSEGRSSRRFRRKTLKTTFNVKHNFGGFADLFEIEKNVDDLY